MSEVIVLGGGCYWCTESVFKSLKGVLSVAPGYAGGTSDNPTYDHIGDHAEVVRIEYEPEQISFENLLTVFFATHDPTTTNRQGADVGSQYRSAIYWTKSIQEDQAIEAIKEINNQTNSGDGVVTETKQLGNFYPAEQIHQNYYQNNPNSAYCLAVINPKLAKVRQKFFDLLKEKSK